MTGFLCNATTSILTAFADQEQLDGFTMWALGSFSGFSWAQVKILYLIALPHIFLSLFLSKPLNVMLFGEKYAATMGLNVKNFQIVIIFFTSVLTAVVTAFAVVVDADESFLRLRLSEKIADAMGAELFEIDDLRIQNLISLKPSFPTECDYCEYYAFCSGGCPSRLLVNNINSIENSLDCIMKKVSFELAKSSISVVK